MEYKLSQQKAEEKGITLKGIKVYLECKNCGRKWAIWFQDEESLYKNLPEKWYQCLGCHNFK